MVGGRVVVNYNGNLGFTLNEVRLLFWNILADQCRELLFLG